MADSNTDHGKPPQARRPLFRGLRGRLADRAPLLPDGDSVDNMLFSNMTLNPQPLHIDRHFCEPETEWGQPLMNSLFTLGLMIGIQVSDMTIGTTIANLGMTDVKFPHPLFEGDTVHCTTEVIGKREFLSRGRAPASSSFTTAPIIRTTCSSRRTSGARLFGCSRSSVARAQLLGLKPISACCRRHQRFKIGNRGAGPDLGEILGRKPSGCGLSCLTSSPQAVASIIPRRPVRSR